MVDLDLNFGKTHLGRSTKKFNEEGNGNEQIHFFLNLITLYRVLQKRIAKLES